MGLGAAIVGGLIGSIFGPTGAVWGAIIGAGIGGNGYPTIGNAPGETSNSEGRIQVLEADFNASDRGILGMSFPYELSLYNAKGKDIFVFARICDANGNFFKSVVPEFGDKDGTFGLYDSFKANKSNFKTKSAFFIPYGIFDINQTQNINIHIDVVANNENILRSVYPVIYTVASDSTIENNQNSKNEKSAIENLIGIISHVIKADGVVAPEEVRTVVDFFNRTGVDDTMRQRIKDCLKQNINNLPNLNKCCKELKNQVEEQDLMVFLALFYNIAVSDNSLPEVEINLIDSIANKFGIPTETSKRIKEDFLPNTDKLWTLFDLPANSSKQELKKAYLAKCQIYHPDKYASLPPEIKKLTEDKFKEIQAAYEELSKRF